MKLIDKLIITIIFFGLWIGLSYLLVLITGETAAWGSLFITWMFSLFIIHYINNRNYE